jgi:isoleucyl-tRNA synthetase
VLVFTAEEVWQTRFPDAEGSVHLSTWPVIDPAWRDEALGAKWARLRRVRSVVTGAIEPLRREKVIGSSLEAKVTLFLADAADRAAVESVPFGEISIVSELTVADAASGGGFALDDVPGVSVAVEPTAQAECARCWRHLPDVADDLCGRCTEAVPHAA